MKSNFIIFKGLTVAKNRLRPERAPLISLTRAYYLDYLKIALLIPDTEK